MIYLDFEIYQNRRGGWRWRLLTVNGRLIAVAAEAYPNKHDCLDAIELVLIATAVPVMQQVHRPMKYSVAGAPQRLTHLLHLGRTQRPFFTQGNSGGILVVIPDGRDISNQPAAIRLAAAGRDHSQEAREIRLGLHFLT